MELSVSVFKATCLSVLERVRSTGQPLLITKRGVPIAQVLPPPPPARGDAGFGALSNLAREAGDLLEPAADLDDWDALSDEDAVQEDGTEAKES